MYNTDANPAIMLNRHPRRQELRWSRVSDLLPKPRKFVFPLKYAAEKNIPEGSGGIWSESAACNSFHGKPLTYRKYTNKLTQMQQPDTLGQNIIETAG